MYEESTQHSAKRKAFEILWTFTVYIIFEGMNSVFIYLLTATDFYYIVKGVGLSVEEATIFWRTAFSKITEDKFNKEYRYNVRHSYGLEGGRKNYPPRK